MRRIVVNRDTKILRLGGRPPRATAILLGVQLGVFLLYIFADAPPWVDRHLALSAGQALGMFELWQPVTALWLHLSVRGLIINLLTLWAFGPPLERWWGRKRFLTFFLLAGLGGLLAGLLVGLAWPQRVVGGSAGSAMALLVAAVMLFPQHLIHFRKLLGIFVRPVALLVGAFAILGTLFDAAWLDLSVHLAGALCGAALLGGARRMRALLARWRLERAKKRFRVVNPPSPDGPRFPN